MTAVEPGAPVEGSGIAVVATRFGADVVGGAEAELRDIALGLAARGWDVDVLTSTSSDLYSWQDDMPAGESSDGSARVLRFPTAPCPSPATRDRLARAVEQGVELPLAEQELWVNLGCRVPGLYHHLLGESGRYRHVIMGPYHAWATYACLQLVPQKAVVVPSLHDEAQARVPILASIFRDPRALMFSTEPELWLAERLYGRLPARTAVCGSGVDVPAGYDEAGFRRRYGIEGPFVLYAGRREGGKNWDWLLDVFARAASAGRLGGLSLVTIGGGDVNPPAAVAGRVRDLGFLPDADRDSAFAAASAYLQPSALESFSRTIMEAWLAGTFVVANAASEVVAWHCERSGAGLLFRDAFELEECLAFVASAAAAEESRSKLGALAMPGRKYVLEHYTWPAVLDSIEAALQEWECASSS